MSLLIAMVGGLAIFAAAFAHQYEKLKKMVPSLDDFSRTTSISGTYSYEQYGRNIVTRIDGKIIHCSVDYGGGKGSCFVPLKHVTPNSRIAADVASVKTTSGITLYPIRIRVGDQVIYAVTPEKSLREWWFGSRLGLLSLPMIFLAMYLYVVFVFFRKNDRLDGWHIPSEPAQFKCLPSPILGFQRASSLSK
jgi:hypothetical protein